VRYTIILTHRGREAFRATTTDVAQAVNHMAEALVEARPADGHVRAGAQAAHLVERDASTDITVIGEQGSMVALTKIP
jgi:hypothetical protein